MKRYVLMAVLGAYAGVYCSAQEIIRLSDKQKERLGGGQQISPRLASDKYFIGFNDEKTAFESFESTDVLNLSADSVIKVSKVEHFIVSNIATSKVKLFIDRVRGDALGEDLNAMRLSRHCFEWFQQTGDMPDLSIATETLKRRHLLERAHKSPVIYCARKNL